MDNIGFADYNLFDRTVRAFVYFDPPPKKNYTFCFNLRLQDKLLL